MRPRQIVLTRRRSLQREIVDKRGIEQWENGESSSNLHTKTTDKKDEKSVTIL